MLTLATECNFQMGLPPFSQNRPGMYAVAIDNENALAIGSRGTNVDASDR